MAAIVAGLRTEQGRIVIFALKVAGMLAGVLILTGLSRLLKLGGEARIRDADHACALVRLTDYGFAGVAAAVDARGTAALVRSADNRHVLIRVRGPRFVSRLLRHNVRARLEPGRLTISLDEPDFPPARLDLGDEAPRWAAALGVTARG